MIVNINEQKAKGFIEKIRPPEDIRDELDFGFEAKGNLFEFFEIRPNWLDPKSGVKNHIPFAKIRYYKSQRIWKLYWFRANDKWELYEPFPESDTIEQLLAVIEQDEQACFFG